MGLFADLGARVSRIFSRRDPAPLGGRPVDNELSMLDRPRLLPVKPAERFASTDFAWSDRYASRPGYALTPAKLLGIFDAADRGWPREMCNLYEDLLERDAHLRSAFENRVGSVAGKEWVLLPGGDRPSDKRAAIVLEQALRAVPNWPETMRHMLWFNCYGYQHAEIVWDRVDGYTVPVWFAEDPPNRFRFDINDEPFLLTGTDQTYGEPLEPGKWWRCRRPGRVTTRAGLMRTCAWWSMFKTTAVRDWLVWAARFGMPLVYGKYDPATEKEDRKAMEQMLRQLGKDGSAIFAKGCEIAIEYVKEGGKATDVHGSLAALCDREISQLVNGATLTSASGSTGASYALGKVHQDTEFNLTAGDADYLGHRFVTDISTPFVQFNGHPGAPPILKVRVMRESDPLSRARTIAILGDLGLPISKEQLYQENQLKRPLNEEDTLVKAPDPEAAATAPGKDAGAEE